MQVTRGRQQVEPPASLPIWQQYRYLSPYPTPQRRSVANALLENTRPITRLFRRSPSSSTNSGHTDESGSSKATSSRSTSSHSRSETESENARLGAHQHNLPSTARKVFGDYTSPESQQPRNPSQRHGRPHSSRLLVRLSRRRSSIGTSSPERRPRRLRLRFTNPRVPGIQCPICMEQESLFNFPQRRITSTCTHRPNICLQCVSQSIKVQMEVKIWDQIVCPLCPGLLTYADMKAWASNDDFQR